MGTHTKRRQRTLLHDEVATQVTQAFAGKSNVAFEVRKNSTVIRLGFSGDRIPRGIHPDPRMVRDRRR